jgi:hypothetical protein
MLPFFLKWPNYDIFMAYSFITVHPFLEKIFAVANQRFFGKANKEIKLSISSVYSR